MKHQSQGVFKRGHIRVDARKAMAKLREHLLVDLHLYAVEMVRAAVSANATCVDIRYDADDVEIAFDAAPVQGETLPHLFEHLTADDASQRPTERLLALSVNAALGLKPAWVTLTTFQNGIAKQVLWSPEIVAAIELEEKPLPKVSEVKAPFPTFASRALEGATPQTPHAKPADPLAIPNTAATRFHFRRKPGWDVVRRAAIRVWPREIQLVADAALLPRIPIFVNGALLVPKARPKVVASASFSLPSAAMARVEILADHETSPHIEFYELGLLLSTAGFSFGRHFPMAEVASVRPPVRIVVDADQLPTNASRSAVRDDSDILQSLARVSAPALSDCISGLVVALFGNGVAPNAVDVDSRDRSLLEDALGAFLCFAHEAQRSRGPLPDALKPLFELPLFQDALGRPLTYKELPQKEPLLVWSGEQPVPPETTPWAREIVWRKGRIAERVLWGRNGMDQEQLVSLITSGAARKKAILAMKVEQPNVPKGDYLAAERLITTGLPGVSDETFFGLTGEVAIAIDADSYVRNLCVRIFHEGRFYEAYALPQEVVPLPCLIALEWPDVFRPRLGYRGIESNDQVGMALSLAIKQSVFMCEVAVLRWMERRGESEPPKDSVLSVEDEAKAAVFRAALATVVLSPKANFSSVPIEMPGLSEFPGLLGANVWPTSSGRAISLQTICAYAAKTGAVCFASASARGKAKDGRPVVTLRTEEAGWLEKCLREGIAMVPYEAALDGSIEKAITDRASATAFVSTQAWAANAPILTLIKEGLHCAMTLGSGGVRVWHRGTLVSGVSLAAHQGGLSAMVDDDSIVPNASWSAVLHSENPHIVGEMERSYANSLVLAILGNPEEQARFTSPNANEKYAWPENRTLLSLAIQRYLIDKAASTDDSMLRESIEGITFLSRYVDGELRAVSLSDIRAKKPTNGKIGYLRAVPGFRPFHFEPLIVADADVVSALTRWSPESFEDVTLELPKQQKIAEQQKENERFLSRPLVDVRAIGPKADNETQALFLYPSPEAALGSLAVTLPKKDFDLNHAIVEASFCGRMVGEQELPGLPIAVIARFDSPMRDHFENFERLSLAGIGVATGRIVRGATELCMKLLERAREPGNAHQFFYDVRALRLVLALLSLPDRDNRIDENLRGNVLRWPTVQGDGRLFGELRMVDGELWAGGVLYTGWVSGKVVTELDRPILYLKSSEEGVLLSKVLEKLGVKVRAVTDAVASLQAKRTEGSPALPTLAVRPVHPDLARPLSSLQVEGVEGEMAIYEAGEAFVELSALDGDRRRVALDISFPARAIARVDVLTTSMVPVIAQKLARAAVRLLVGLIRNIETLPLFVRTHVRTLACRAIQQGRALPEAAQKANVFPDVDGSFWSAADLFSNEKGPWSCTFDPPPYASHRQEGKTLLLTMTEHLQLHEKLKIVNVTEWMRRELAAEQRKTAPPAPEIRFAEEIRSNFIRTKVIRNGSLEGEIGLLKPMLGHTRGIQVFTTRRFVCTIADAPGWPMVAVVNDDSLKPNRWWTELLPVQETALRNQINEERLALFRETFIHFVPKDALASSFVDEAVPASVESGPIERLRITGYLYFPKNWPIKPSVRLFVRNIAEPAAAPLAIATAIIAPTLPIEGTLFISHEAPTVTVALASRASMAVRGLAGRLLQKLLLEKPSDPEVLTYLWNLRLLGETFPEEPTAKAADGATLTFNEVEKALYKNSLVWLTERQGSIEGAFPDVAKEGEPPFVLVNESSPLMRVLRARLPASRFRLLGGLAGQTAASTVAPTAGLDTLAPKSTPRPGAAPFDAGSGQNAFPNSWFGKLFDRARNYLQNTPLSERDQKGISVLVEQTLSALRLRTTHRVSVHEVRRGRLVTYDKLRQAVYLNVDHEALKKPLASPSPQVLRRVCLVLVSAAITEINIELEGVTDSDEAQALVELLRQEAALGTQTG